MFPASYHITSIAISTDGCPLFCPLRLIFHNSSSSTGGCICREPSVVAVTAVRRYTLYLRPFSRTIPRYIREHHLTSRGEKTSTLRKPDLPPLCRLQIDADNCVSDLDGLQDSRRIPAARGKCGNVIHRIQKLSACPGPPGCRLCRTSI